MADITINTDFGDLNKISNEVLLWELFHRYRPQPFAGNILGTTRLFCDVPVFGLGAARITISSDAYKLIVEEE